MIEGRQAQSPMIKCNFCRKTEKHKDALVKRLLHTLRDEASQDLHKTQVKAFYNLVEASLDCNRMTSASLGRSFKTGAAKHNLKKVDKFLGSTRLHEDMLLYYSFLAKTLLGKAQAIEVAIDWCRYEGGSLYHLTASVTLSVRSLPIYQEAHPELFLGNAEVQDNFLRCLREVIGKERQVLLLVDRGFSVLFFKSALAYGYHYLGRAATECKYCCPGEERWRTVREEYTISEGSDRLLGEVFYTKKHSHRCHFFIHKGKRTGRIVKNRDGSEKRSSMNKRSKRRHAQPWVLISSRPITDVQMGRKLVKSYGRRMQIEQNFRDIKSSRFGMGLKLSRTKNSNRLNVLLLVAAFAQSLLFMVGLIGEKKKLQRKYQANTISSRRVISLVYLGREMLKRLAGKEKIRLIVQAIAFARSKIPELITNNAIQTRIGASYVG